MKKESQDHHNTKEREEREKGSPFIFFFCEAFIFLSPAPSPALVQCSSVPKALLFLYGSGSSTPSVVLFCKLLRLYVRQRATCSFYSIPSELSFFHSEM